MRRYLRRHALLLILPLACWPVAAAAQSGAAALVGPADPTLHSQAARPDLPDFRPRGDYRMPPGPVRDGLIGAVPLGRNARIAVGRFAVPDFTASRPDAAEVRRRDRRMAAIGFALRF